MHLKAIHGVLGVSFHPRKSPSPVCPPPSLFKPQDPPQSKFSLIPKTSGGGDGEKIRPKLLYSVGRKTCSIHKTRTKYSKETKMHFKK